MDEKEFQKVVLKSLVVILSGQQLIIRSVSEGLAHVLVAESAKAMAGTIAKILEAYDE